MLGLLDKRLLPSVPRLGCAAHRFILTCLAISIFFPGAPRNPIWLFFISHHPIYWLYLFAIYSFSLLLLRTMQGYVRYCKRKAMAEMYVTTMRAVWSNLAQFTLLIPGRGSLAQTTNRLSLRRPACVNKTPMLAIGLGFC